jgi:hypothetical protein
VGRAARLVYYLAEPPFLPLMGSADHRGNDASADCRGRSRQRLTSRQAARGRRRGVRITEQWGRAEAAGALGFTQKLMVFVVSADAPTAMEDVLRVDDPATGSGTRVFQTDVPSAVPPLVSSFGRVSHSRRAKCRPKQPEYRSPVVT